MRFLTQPGPEAGQGAAVKSSSSSAASYNAPTSVSLVRSALCAPCPRTISPTDYASYVTASGMPLRRNRPPRRSALKMCKLLERIAEVVVKRGMAAPADDVFGIHRTHELLGQPSPPFHHTNHRLRVQRQRSRASSPDCSNTATTVSRLIAIIEAKKSAPREQRLDDGLCVHPSQKSTVLST